MRTSKLAKLCVLGGATACAPAAESGHSAAPEHFVQASAFYVIGDVVATVEEWDDELSLFGISDVEATEAGYLLAESGNRRLTLLDGRLKLLGTRGRRGDGPGEYQFPESMARAGDRVVVLDLGINRASYVGFDGTFLSGVNVSSNPSDVAHHPEFGLVVADDHSSVHYLSQLRPGGNRRSLAEIPTPFRNDDPSTFRIRTDLVAVAADGSIHVLDGLHLALVSYASDGAYVRTAYLPEPGRTNRLERRDRQINALGGPSVVVASHLALSLQPLADGRLFVRTSSLNLDDQPGVVVLGYVLDLSSLDATPLAVAAGDERGYWIRNTGVHFGAETALLYARSNRGGPQLAVAEVELAER